MEPPERRWAVSSVDTADTPGAEGASSLGAPAMGGGAATRSVISRKELARDLRRQAYQRAKAWRAADPKQIEMKAAAKVKRREAYQQVKERRKAAEASSKTELRAKRAAELTQSREGVPPEARRQAVARLKSALGAPSPAVEPPAKSNDSADLQGEIANALKNKRVLQLVQRLSLESAEPGLTANNITNEDVTNEDVTEEPTNEDA